MDVTDCYAVAAHIDALAQALPGHARTAAGVAETLEWHSLAAIAFRAKAQAVCLDATGLATAMSALAAAIRVDAGLRAALP